MTAIGNSARQLGAHAARGFRGVFLMTHNGFTLIGLAVVFILVTLFVHPNLRDTGEQKLTEWLLNRRGDMVGLDLSDADAIDRATATNPKDLPKNQAALADWLSRKYHVAPEPLSALVTAAYDISRHTKLEPTLLLAVMAIESGFNPFAQSQVGAQGLMQVMTAVHTSKYESFGGKLAAFDPVTNVRVGARVLQECIERGGSLEAGLKLYVGVGTPSGDDGGYTAKVLSEQARLQQVAQGRQVPLVASAEPAAVASPTPRPITATASARPTSPVAARAEKLALAASAQELH